VSPITLSWELNCLSTGHVLLMTTPMLHRHKRVSELSVVVRCGTSRETGNAPNILAGKRQEKIHE